MSKNIYFIYMVLFFLFICFNSHGQSFDNERIVELEKGEYTLTELIEHLEKIRDLELSYNSKELPVEMRIAVGKSNPTVLELIEYLKEQKKIEVIANDNYLVFRKKVYHGKFTIEGKITDMETGESLVGVTVMIKGLQTGSVTDQNGYYKLSADAGDFTLVFSFLGYKTQEIEIQLYSNQHLDIELRMERIFLEEVRIVGEHQFFGNLNEGRTIQSIEIKEIESVKTNNTSDILQARMSGVWVTKVSGAPGDHNQIRIRGMNSLFGGVDPLYVIDGVPVPIVNLHSLGISDLNVHDVENITVLKDASSNAIYGFQGGNGVIIIDTKRGGDKEINFSVTQGVQEMPVRYDLFNTSELLTSLDSSYKLGISRIRRHYPRASDTLCSDDWQNKMFQTGTISEYQLSAGGTWNKNKYYISGDYYKHKGVVTNSDYSKYSLSASLGRNFSKRLSIEGVYKTSRQQNRNNLDSYWGNRVITEEINKSPVFLDTPIVCYVDTISGGEHVRTYIDYQDLHTREHPDSLLRYTNKDLDIITHNISGFASLRIHKNLFLNYSAAYALRKHQYNTSLFSYYYFPEFNNYLESSEIYALANNQFNLSYGQAFEKHNLNFVSSAKFYRDMVRWNLDSLAAEFDTKTKQENLYTRGNLAILGESGKAIRHINSLLGHVNYNYAEKYFVSVAANYENLKEGDTRDITHLFPSLALKWDISKENGLKNINWLDQFNLMFNWGRSGNYPLNGLSKNLFSSERYIYPDRIDYGFAVDNLANYHVKPEIIEGYNLGTEVSLFHNRLIFQVNYYEKKNQNLIIQRDIPYYYGGGRIYINVAEMHIHGNEYKVEIWPLKNSEWIWYSRLNVSTFKQQVKKLDDDEKYYYNDDILIPDFSIKENYTLGNMIGYKYLGKVKTGTSEEDFNNVIFVGGGMYKISNPEKTALDSTDKTIIGNMMPDFTFNFYNSLRFRNISLDMLWYGVLGVDKYNATKASTFISGLNSELYNFISDTNTVITSEVFYESSYFIEDASFIRLKNISITYLPEKLLYNKIRVKITLGIDNLFTITRYKGYDPESTIYTDNTFSDNAVDYGAYPNPRTYYISINFKF